MYLLEYVATSSLGFCVLIRFHLNVFSYCTYSVPRVVYDFNNKYM